MYLGLCPRYYKKANFYLKLLASPRPKQWYCEQVVGQNTLEKTIANLMKDADIAGYFTNHSARRTGGTRLFRGGVECKLVKEATGHSSDAVDKYQITSEEQRMLMSGILANRPKESCNDNLSKKEGGEVESCDNNKGGHIERTNVKQVSLSDVQKGNVGEMINSIIEKNMSKGKTVIKIQIEISHE